jgi:hypothetical protein
VLETKTARGGGLPRAVPCASLTRPSVQSLDDPQGLAGRPPRPGRTAAHTDPLDDPRVLAGCRPRPGRTAGHADPLDDPQGSAERPPRPGRTAGHTDRVDDPQSPPLAPTSGETLRSPRTWKREVSPSVETGVPYVETSRPRP